MFILQTFRSGIDVANELSARLLCLILVEKSTLWVTSANGCLLTVDADTYSPLTCLQIQGSELRHMLWLPHSGTFSHMTWLTG